MLVSGNDIFDPKLKSQCGPKIVSVLGKDRFEYLYNSVEVLDNCLDREWLVDEQDGDECDEYIGSLIIAIPDHCDVRMYQRTVIIDGKVYRISKPLKQCDNVARDILLDYRDGDLEPYWIEGATHAITCHGWLGDQGEDLILYHQDELEDATSPPIPYPGYDRLVFNTHKIARYVTSNNGNQFLPVKILGVPCEEEGLIIAGCVGSNDTDIWLMHRAQGAVRYRLSKSVGSVDCIDPICLMFNTPISRINCIGVVEDTLWVVHDGVADVYSTKSLRLIRTVDGVYQLSICEDPIVRPRVVRIKSARN